MKFDQINMEPKDGGLVQKIFRFNWVSASLHPIAVTTRIITFLVGNPNLLHLVRGRSNKYLLDLKPGSTSDSITMDFYPATPMVQMAAVFQ